MVKLFTISWLLCVIGFLCIPDAIADEWHTLEGCRLVKGAYGDGDSFRIKHDGKELIIRLYFVDCPEENNEYPERVRDQAKHHGKSIEEVMHVGEQATTATMRLLSKPFTVITRFQDARGASSLPRYYGFVLTSENRDLGEILVANGLARSHGAVARYKHRSAKDFAARYDRLDERARRGRVGIYSESPMRRLRMADLNLEAEISDDEPSAIDAMLAERGDQKITPAETQTAGLQTPEPNDPRAQPEMAMSVASTESPNQEFHGAPDVITESSDSKIDLNTATQEELESLPGIGPVLAQRIIENRPYTSVEDLRRVPGIGPQKLSQIQPLALCEL